MLSHRIGGSMALKFCRVTLADLERWAKALRALADERVAEAEAAGIAREVLDVPSLNESAAA